MSLSELGEVAGRAGRRTKAAMAIYFALFAAFFADALLFKTNYIALGAIVLIPLVFLYGAVATIIEYRTFRSYWLASGLSKKEIHAKWNAKYPGGA